MTMWIYVALGVIIGSAVSSVPAYMYGLSVGAESERVVHLEASIKADNNRRKIDAETSSRAASDLCRSFGLHNDAISECMRRVQETDTER